MLSTSTGDIIGVAIEAGQGMASDLCKANKELIALEPVTCEQDWQCAGVRKCGAQRRCEGRDPSCAPEDLTD